MPYDQVAMLIDDGSRQRGRAEQRAFRDRMASDLALAVTRSNERFRQSRALRRAIKMTTCVAIGSAFAWLALLHARGQIHGKEIHHDVRVAEVSAIQLVLSTEETIGLKSPPPKPMQVAEVDAPWTPYAADAKPWTPAPYAKSQTQ
jgi:hypothetical protein